MDLVVQEHKYLYCREHHNQTNARDKLDRGEGQADLWACSYQYLKAQGEQKQ
jgi:hypothetical protein